MSEHWSDEPKTKDDEEDDEEDEERMLEESKKSDTIAASIARALFGDSGAEDFKKIFGMSINWNGIGWFFAGLFAAEKDSRIAFFLFLAAVGSLTCSEWKAKRGKA